MELISYLQILRRRKWTILITMIVTLVVAVVGHALLPVTYETSAVVRIIPYSTGNPSYNEIMYADRVMKTYLEIGSSSAIMTTLRETLGLPPDRDIDVDVEIIPDTELLRITVKDQDPVLATDVANALVAYLINDKTVRDVRVTLMEPAIPPKPPSVIGNIAFYILVLISGVLGGMGLAFVRENIDVRLYDKEQIKNITNWPVLCWLPLVPRLRPAGMIADHFPYNHVFQRLSIILRNKVRGKHLKTILVTSSVVDEGKSTLAANLAGSLGRSGFKTLLVDADIYKPTIHHYFGLAKGVGLCNLLYSEVASKEVIQKTDVENLFVITSGSNLGDHNGLVNGMGQMKEIIKELYGQYDFLIFDSPACLGPVDSMVLAQLVDGILVVVRLGVTQPLSLKTTCEQLEFVPSNVVGIVVNGMEKMHSKDLFDGQLGPKNDHAVNMLKGNLVKKKQTIREKFFHTIVSHEET